MLTALLFLLTACDNNTTSNAATPETPKPPAASASPDAGKPVSLKPEAQDGAEQSPADCQASDTVIFTQKSGPIDPNSERPVTTVQIYDNGHWSLSGAEGVMKEGCMNTTQLQAVQEKLAAAVIEAPPLEKGMARCMALPISRITVEAKGQTAQWDAPCGGNTPDASLDALAKTITDLTLRSDR